jgi:predicted metal-dependent peptidase
MSALSKLQAARTSLIIEQPFFGCLALSLILRADTGCGTAWVDGRTFGFEPAFIESLTHERTKGLVAHEVMHCALGHPWRRTGREMAHWNIACDKTINSQLRDAGFTLPADGHFAERDEIGKSAEWIFERIYQKREPDPDGNPDQSGNGQNDGNGPGSNPDPLGEVRDAPNNPDPDGNPAPTEQAWKERASQALQHAQFAGNAPEGIARAIQQALKPRIDIRSLMLRFFSERATGDYSWTRPNTRYIAHGLYLPSLDSRELGEVAILVDTSGSVDETSLSYARSIVESVFDECSPAGVTVYYADADVCRVDRFEKGEPLTWQPEGGGGTDFRPALDAIEREALATCAICITDLDGTFPDTAPSFPVLWLSTEVDATAPFGETVYIDR